ncbi:oxysterol-binding protein-related protein 11 [Dermatophagoides pteronyssinus]|uniref:Oxysterol-binding protein-related protein 11-like n=1 Tax=Dermatophagoides pteronyssinus TaxID=6956 RepID=A0A6P6YLN1_DERPT|nr:oxysterol-binding protein-related protein 11-like [Dermatophagoides pteronyssinus]
MSIDQQKIESINSHKKTSSIKDRTNESIQELSSDTKLTSQELDHLCSVMLRAKEFDEKESKIFEGQLCKYTNVVKGWQYRWFVINSARGVLEYYASKDRHKLRGCFQLANCQVMPSDEDSQTFSVHSAYGEVYKLKAANAKDRQKWVDNLRLAVQLQENKVQKNLSINSVKPNNNNNQMVANSPLTSDLLSSFDGVQNQLLVAKDHYDTIVKLIENVSNTDEDLLILKATSLAAINSLERCFSVLESLNYKIHYKK